MNLPPVPGRDRVTPLCPRTHCLCLHWIQAQTGPRPTSPVPKWEKQGCRLCPGGWPSPTSGSLQVLGKAEPRPRGRGQAGQRARGWIVLPPAAQCCTGMGTGGTGRRRRAAGRVRADRQGNTTWQRG